MLDTQTEQALYSALDVDPAVEAAGQDLEAALTKSTKQRHVKLTWLGGILFVVFLPLIAVFAVGCLLATVFVGTVLVAGIVCLPFFPVIFGMGTMKGSGR